MSPNPTPRDLPRESLTSDARRALRDHVARYARPDDRVAWRMLGSTLLGYGASLAGATWLFDRARLAADVAHRAALYAAGAVLVLLLAGAMLRAFMLHHDICHGGFFASRKLSRILAPFVGALVSTSPSVWSREHDRHHRDSNNLDLPQDGETASWTVADYARAPRWQRWIYFVANQRPILFVLVPPLYFLGFMRVRARLHENLVFLAFALLLVRTGAWFPFALAILPASCFGFLAFHAQHTFVGVRRERAARWDFVDNALYGSSLLSVPSRGVLGAWLAWALFSVEYHHVHHLHPGVPAYRLAACHRDGGAMFDGVARVTIADALHATRFSLFDEAERSLVTFAGREPWR